MTALAYQKWIFTRVSKERILTGKFWCFGLEVGYGSWSLTTGGRIWRLDCKNDRDSRRLALECKLQILVSLKVFGMESYYICQFRYRLGLRIKKFTKNALTLTRQKSTSGVSLSLSHTYIGLPWGFNLNFPISITVTFIGKYARGLYQIVLLKTFLQLPKSPISVVSVVIPKLLGNHFGVKTANKKRKVFLINDG